jgi:CHASE3 domain sensor protein
MNNIQSPKPVPISNAIDNSADLLKQRKPQALIKWTREGKWITAGFGLVLVLMGSVNFVSYQNAIQLADSVRRVRQTNAILKSLTSISATLIDAESGRRGYILFGDPEELKRYNAAVKDLQPQINRLRQTLTDTPSQQERLDQLESLVAKRLDLFQQSIQYYRNRTGQLPTKDPLVVQIKQIREDIRRLITELIAEEEDLLEAQVEHYRQNHQVRLMIELLGTLLMFVVLLGVYALL